MGLVLSIDDDDDARVQASMGFGIINFVFALPAVYAIDTFGRRNLLLSTFPFMAIFHLLTGLGFLFKGKTQTVLVMIGMCEFCRLLPTVV